MSKKFLMCGILVFSIFVLSACGEDNKEDNKKEETQVIEEVKKEEAKFEEFAYYKKNNDRHFQIYTQTKNKELLIEEAKRRAWTEGKITVVSSGQAKMITKFLICRSLKMKKQVSIWKIYQI